MLQSAVYCAMCASRIAVGTSEARADRRRQYCSNACRQRAYRQRLATRHTEVIRAPSVRGGGPGSGLRRPTIPLRLDRFIGRTRELQQLRALDDHPLVTVTGPPGTGKSRLLMRLLELDHAEGPCRVLWVDADRLRRAEAVQRALAEALGAVPGDLGSLIAQAGKQRLLVVLDNCECLVADIAHLVETLLLNCPGLRIRITSREAVRFPGEVVIGVGPLGLPEQGDWAADHRGLLRYEAAQLFVERASTGNPDFVFGPVNADAVAELCAELDGLPLSLEFAARWVGVLTVVELLARIRESAGLPSGASRTAGDRHNSFPAVLETSYRRLDPAEQAAFRALSVLDQAFGLEPGAAVCGFGAESAGEATDLLSRLQAKSLLTTSVDSPGGVRFHQLRSIRRFAARLRVEAGETEECWDRLTAWLVRLYRPASRVVTPPKELLDKLDDMREYLVSGAAWAARHDDPRHVLLVAAAGRALWTQGEGARFRYLASRALQQDAPEVDKAVLLTEMAIAERMLGAVPDACGLAAEAVGRSRDAGDPAVHCRALSELGTCLRLAGNYRAALDPLREALLCAQAAGDETCAANTAACLEQLAHTSLASGDLHSAALLIRGIRPADAADGADTARILGVAADIALAAGRVDAAEAHCLAALDAVPDEAAYVHRPVSRLAAVSALRGDHVRAFRLAEAAAVLRERLTVVEREWQDDWVDWVGRQAAPGPDTAETRVVAEAMSPHEIRAFALGGPWPPRKPDGPESDLRSRQRAIALLVAEGLTNRQIASRIGVSSRTVVADLTRLRRGLALQSRAQVAAWARTALSG